MIPYPHISPIALAVGPVRIYWYGIAYLVTFLIAYLFIPKFLKEKKIKMDKDFMVDLLLNGLLGVILGGRLGYILFYQLPYYAAHPLNMMKVWEGGMSFHGGMLGVILGLLLFARKRKLHFYTLTDAIVPIIPIGIFIVRVGNFINAELYGRITSSWICMKFPTDLSNCRYPSQLIEAILEGVLPFIIIYTLRNKTAKRKGLLSWLFILVYGIMRCIGELFREPDRQIGYIFQIFTEGQILSLLMIVIAGIAIKKILHKK